MDRLAHIQDTLELNHILDRNISDLSGGELQRFAIGIIRSVTFMPILLLHAVLLILPAACRGLTFTCSTSLLPTSM